MSFPQPPPRSFLLFQDPVLAGAGDGILLDSTFTSAAAPDGVYADVAAPGEDNRGQLQVTQAGAPASRAQIDYRVVASGGVWNEAAWAWKRRSETNPTDNLSVVWRGCNDGRYWWAAHDPFGNDADYATAYNAGCYSSANRTELLYRVSASTGQVFRAVRTVDDHAYASNALSAAAWSIAGCVLDGGNDLVVPDPLAAEDAALAVVELENGVICMILVNEGGTDVRVLHSDDGKTWTVVADDIISRFGPYRGDLTNSNVQGWRFQRSGPYLRLAFTWNDTDVEVPGATTPGGTYVRTMVSSDNGATWKEVSDFSTPDDWKPNNINTTGFDTRLFTIGALDDSVGSFFLFIRVDGNGPDLVAYSATGMEGWVRREDLDWNEGSLGLGLSGYQMAAIRGPQYLYLFDWVTDVLGGGVYCRIFLIDPRNPYSFTGWKYQSRFFSDFGAMRFNPRGISLYNVGGNYLALTAYLIDGEDSDSLVEEGGLYMRLGGWDSLPVEERVHPRTQSARNRKYMLQPGENAADTSVTVGYSLGIIAWESWMGTPTPGAGPYTAAASPWTRSAHNGTTQAWDTSQLVFTDAAAPSATQWANQYEDDVLEDSWFCGLNTLTSCMLEWVIKVEQSGSATLNNDDIAIRLQSYDMVGGTGDSADISIRHTSTNILVHDNISGSSIVPSTAIPNLATQFIKFRLGILCEAWTPGGDIKFALWYRSEEDATANWTLVATGDISRTGTGTTQSIQFGHINLLTSLLAGDERISHWRRVALYGFHDGGATRCIADAWGNPSGGADNDDTVLDNLRGRAATTDEVLVEQGLTARVQGGAAFEGDTFHGEVNYSFHPRNLTMVASPRIGYRSATPNSGTTAVNLDYDAGWDETGRRFFHSGLALFGYAARSVTVYYSNDSAFAAATTLGPYDLTLYGPARVNSLTAGNGIVLQTTDPGCPPLGEARRVPGGLIYYMQVTAGSCANSVGKVWSVEYDEDTPSGKRTFVIAPRDNDVDSYQLSGASVVFFADRAILLYSAATSHRYMRISMPSTVTAYRNQHRLGTFIAGTTMVFSPGLEWAFSDAEMPNTTEHKTRGGLRWSYREGPPQRVYEGNMVGDVDTLRRRMRSYLGAIAQYDQFPVAFCMDDLDRLHPAKMMLGTVQSGSEFVQSGWKWDDGQSRWLAVGDQKLTIAEDT